MSFDLMVLRLYGTSGDITLSLPIAPDQFKMCGLI